MKKLLALTIIALCASALALSAYTFPDFFYPQTSFKPVSARTEAMGGAGLATARGADMLFVNPANLGQGGFSLNLPSVSLTVYNPLAIIESGIIEDVQAGGDPEAVAASALNKYMGIVAAGVGEVLTTDIQTSMTAGGLGFGLQIQEQLHTTSTDGAITSDKFLAEVNVGLTVGLGFRIDLIPDWFSIDFGASGKFIYKAYSSRFGASEVLALTSSADPLYDIMALNKAAAGWAMPVDAGANVNLPLGLRASAVARNLNAVFTMNSYSELGAWVNEMAEYLGVDPVYVDQAPDAAIEAFTYEIPWTLDVGVGWAPDLGGSFKPRLAVDMTDLLGYLEIAEPTDADLLDRLSAGVEVRLANMLDVRAGINKGYQSVGLGLDLLLVHVDASYYWREYGQNIGDKQIDAFTVRVNLGIDG